MHLSSLIVTPLDYCVIWRWSLHWEGLAFVSLLRNNSSDAFVFKLVCLAAERYSKDNFLPTNRKSLVVSILSAGTFVGTFLAFPMGDLVGRKWGIMRHLLSWCRFATRCPLANFYRRKSYRRNWCGMWWSFVSIICNCSSSCFRASFHV